MRQCLLIASITILLMAFLAAFLGIYKPELYQDNFFVKTAWFANDWVTLVIAIPSLLLCMWLSGTKKLKADLIWMGLLSYFFYNYAFYLFGSVFNSMFLIYVGIFSLSFFSLLGFLAVFPVNRISFSPKANVWVTTYLMILVLMLCLIEIPPCISYITSGKIPELIPKTGHVTNIVYALDLSFIVPAMLIAAILNLKKNVWGGVLSTIMLVKGVIYGLVLLSGTLLLMSKGIADPLLPVWIFIAAGGMAALYLLLRNAKVEAIPKVSLANEA